MPVKIARSTPRPSFGLRELLVASRCKIANLHAGFGVIRGMSVEGSTVLGTATLNNGSATLSVTLPVGTHNIHAHYSGS